MSDKLRVQIISPDSVIHTGAAEMVTLPGKSGYLGVLAGHVPMTALLATGEITIDHAGEQKRFAVREGVAQITPSVVTILSHSATAA